MTFLLLHARCAPAPADCPPARRRDALLGPVLLLLAGAAACPAQNPSGVAGRPESATPPPVVLQGLAFSPWMDGQDPTQGAQVSEAQLRARMAIVAPTTRVIRTYGVDAGLQVAGRVAHELGLQAAVGAWIGPDPVANAAQVAQLIQIAQAGEADVLVVGNEVLLRGDLSAAGLVALIDQVRAGAPPGLPVTTADTPEAFLQNPLLVDAVDAAWVNLHPYWEGVPVAAAVQALAARVEAVRAVLGGKPLVVAETGWPSDGLPQGGAVPSPGNALTYLRGFLAWAAATRTPYLWFSGFDEAWKAAYEGPQGAHWGLWDTDGVLKPGVESVLGGPRVLGTAGEDGDRMPTRAASATEASTPSSPAPDPSEQEAPSVTRVEKTEAEWRALLTPEQFRITRQAGTEPAFSGAYWDSKQPGSYLCVGCATPLFTSEHKFDSGTGWPSFSQPMDPQHVATKVDRKLFRRRTEVLCAVCDGHLGHVFDDGPAPTGLRYCINSAALKLEPQGPGR